MIYLDNASTTHTKPRSVIHSAKQGLTKYSVNAGRGGYDLSILAGEKVLDTREYLANMFNAPTPTGVIFTGSCTQAINLALRGTVKDGGHIVTTCMEHNSVLRTLEDLKKSHNIDYTVVSCNNNGNVTAEDIKKAIRPNTYMVATIHISNVTGATNNIEQIGLVAKEHNLIYMVDCAQSAGHMDIDMQSCHINLMTIAGHKGFYAPQGIGVLLINDTNVRPIITGGTGTFSESINQPTDLPEGLESGTLSVSNILALGSGAKFVNKHAYSIVKKNYHLTTYLINQLKKINGVKLYSKFNTAGVVSFNIGNLTSSEVSTTLFNKHKICVRSGLQCAPLIHKHHGTLSQGMVRVSIGYFNTKHQLKVLIKAISGIAKKLG